MKIIWIALGVVALLAGSRAARRREPRSTSSPTRRRRRPTARSSPLPGRPPPGRASSFTQSYGASGDQARAVAAGLPADVVALSLAPDVDALVKAGLVAATGTRATATTGIVTDSVVVFVVRKGNPKHIKTWDDLVKPGVQVLTPNPFTSGGARWNVMAAYGAQRSTGKTDKQAIDVPAQALPQRPVRTRARATRCRRSLGGKGDVLLDYENEAIFAQKKGVHAEYYVIPKATILIENPIAVTKTGRRSRPAKAFLEFLCVGDGAASFGEQGYRPVDQERRDELSRLPTRRRLFTID